jgi:5'-3' exonuclease
MTETTLAPPSIPVVPPDAVVLIDLSSIAHPIWHMSQANPDANHASQQIVARVRDLARGFPHVAICCDAGRSFRHALAPSYKANRPESEAPLQHQILLACEQLAADGFPIWKANGFEADDVIAAACKQALAIEGGSALIVSADKDLLQLVGERVLAKSVRDGSILDAAAVATKFGVRPDQMRDYLTLVGDASDNILGAKGIGPKTAAKLLETFGTLDTIYRELGLHGTKFKPATATALQELRPRLEAVRTLIGLRTDVPIPFEEIAVERVPKEASTFGIEDEDMADELTGEQAVQAIQTALGEQAAAQIAEREPPKPMQDGGQVYTNGVGAPAKLPTPPPTSTALATRDSDLAPAPPEWERQLDPRGMPQAIALAKNLYESRLFSAYGTPQAVLSTVMLGRELGLPAMASLRSVHIIDGKHSLAASLMVALVLKSGLAEYFEPISFTEKEATYETLRRGARNPVRLTHTMEMALQAWPKAKRDWEAAFQASGWGRTPTDMLVARATSRLARMVYPDLLAGLYTPEELIEIREQKVAA